MLLYWVALLVGNSSKVNTLQKYQKQAVGSTKRDNYAKSW